MTAEKSGATWNFQKKHHVVYLALISFVFRFLNILNSFLILFFLPSSADNKVFQAGHTNLFKTWVELQNDGSCSWESPANLESECNVQIDLFPFDQQNCSLFFGSATYGSEHLVIVKPQNDKGKQNKTFNNKILR